MISVLMITYNHEQYIQQAIEGVLMQQGDFPFELVIGEDCSTDSTRKICEEFAQQYPDIIRLLSSEKNLGMMPNFIRTLHTCTGKYIAMCEGDDYWTDPLKLQKQVDFLESNPDYGLVHTNCKIHEQFSKKPDIIANYSCFNGNVVHKLIKHNFIITLSVCFRSELLQKIDLNDTKSNQFLMGDYPLWIQIANISKIHYINEITGTYRIMPQSSSHSMLFGEKEKFLLSNLRVQLYYLKKYNITEISEKDLEISNYYNLLNYAFVYGDYLKAKQYIEKFSIKNFDIFIKYIVTRKRTLFDIYTKVSEIKKIITQVLKEHKFKMF